MSLPERIFLVGPMGAGKSAVGRCLAQLLDYDFTDTDHEIEKSTGVDIPFIFEKEGEAGFRLRETRAFEALGDRKRIVVATGGGCVVTEANRHFMAAAGYVIYLSASVNQLYERVRHGNSRPLLDTDNPRGVLRDLLAARGPLYEALADLVIDTDRRRVRDVAMSAVRHLRQDAGPEPHANR